MRGTILYGTAGVRFEDVAGPEDYEADRRGDSPGRDVRVRIGPLELSGDQPSRAAHERTSRHKSAASTMNDRDAQPASWRAESDSIVSTYHGRRNFINAGLVFSVVALWRGESSVLSQRFIE
jgi:hypothetical protein